MKRMKVFFITLMLALLIPSMTYADTGPKPSVNVRFSGLDNITYYVTLLSKTDSTGPFSSYEQDSSRWKEGDEDYDIFKKFLSYKDSDGYYFLQYFNKCSDNSQFSWTYYPPSDFKILIYFPDIDTFAVSSEAYQRYAFDSYYKVDLSKTAISASKVPIKFSAEGDYNYYGEALAMLARIVITIVIELLIALLFKYRTKHHMAAIGITNVATQTILNLLLNLVNQNKPQIMFVFYYAVIELGVFFIEAKVYSALFRCWERYEEGGTGHPVAYAFIANAASFAAGLWIARLIPVIF